MLCENVTLFKVTICCHLLLRSWSGFGRFDVMNFVYVNVFNGYVVFKFIKWWGADASMQEIERASRKRWIQGSRTRWVVASEDETGELPCWEKWSFIRGEGGKTVSMIIPGGCQRFSSPVDALLLSFSNELVLTG